MAGFTIPDEAEVGVGDPRARLFQTHLETLALGHGGTGVIWGGEVAAQGSPNMTVAVAAADVKSLSTLLSFGGGTGTITTADGSNPRFDVVVVTSGNALAVRAGTPAATPVMPPLTTGDVPLAQIYIPASDTTISSDQICDLRILLDGRWKVNVAQYLDFTENIYRDDSASYPTTNAWISLARGEAAPITMGQNRPLINLEFGHKHAGTIVEQAVGLRVVASDQTTVVTKAITGAANNGSGLIRITATAHTFATGNRIAVYAVGGVPNANGLWLVTVIDANTFDLQGSTFAGTYTSGGFASNRGLFYCALLVAYPRVSRGGYAGSNGLGNIANADDINCLAMINAQSATAKGTDCLYIGNGGGAGSAWVTLFTSDAHADFGIRLNGTHANQAIDLSSGTSTSGHAIKLRNNEAISSLNNAGSTTIKIARVTTGDQLRLYDDLVSIDSSGNLSAVGVQASRTGAAGVVAFLRSDGGAGMLLAGGSNAGFYFDDSQPFVIAMQARASIGVGVGSAAGATTRISIDTSGHVSPGANNTQDLGLTGTRWRTLYAGTDVNATGRLIGASVEDGHSWPRAWYVVTTAAATTEILAGPTLTAVDAVAASNQKNVRGEWLRISATANNADSSRTTGYTLTRTDADPIFAARVEIPTAIVNYRLFLGLCSATFVMTTDTQNTLHTAYFRFSTGASDTAWQCCTSNGTTTQVQTSGITVAADTVYALKIDCTDSANIKFYINGALVATNSTTVPTSTTALGAQISLRSLSASGQKDIDVAWWKVLQP